MAVFPKVLIQVEESVYQVSINTASMMDSHLLEVKILGASKEEYIISIGDFFDSRTQVKHTSPMGRFTNINK
jgi:hypothetical protein